MSDPVTGDTKPDLSAPEGRPFDRLERQNSLEKSLKYRPDAQDLKNRHILLDSKAAPALQSAQAELERNRAADAVKKGLDKRPGKEALVERNILPSSTAAPGLIASQKSLEKHMRADSLEQKIQQRPKPDELIKEGILVPEGTENPVKEAQATHDMGTKRTRDGVLVENPTDNTSPYIPMFQQFQSELDEHHDRRERMIKTSRDVTAQSKKIIFALQRTRELGHPIHESIKKQTTPMYDIIRGLLQNAVQDSQGLDAYRYQKNISGGIQEFMEAVLFQHYLETKSVMNYEDAMKTLPEGLTLTYEDYLLGLFDMTGELMRFAITYLATNGSLPGSSDAKSVSASSVLSDLQTIACQFEIMDAHGSYALAKDFETKLRTTRASVEKVENSVYSMIVRGKERPRGWRPEISTADRYQVDGADDGD